MKRVLTGMLTPRRPLPIPHPRHHHLLRKERSSARGAFASLPARRHTRDKREFRPLLLHLRPDRFRRRIPGTSSQDLSLATRFNRTRIIYCRCQAFVFQLPRIATAFLFLYDKLLFVNGGARWRPGRLDRK